MIQEYEVRVSREKAVLMEGDLLWLLKEQAKAEGFSIIKVIYKSQRIDWQLNQTVYDFMVDAEPLKGVRPARLTSEPYITPGRKEPKPEPEPEPAAKVGRVFNFDHE